MEKRIVLKMLDNKDISVVCNGKIFMTIKSDQRSIRAEQIYNLLDYSEGDIYTLEKKNEKKIDEPVLNFFYDLLSDIIEPINGDSDEKNKTS